MSALCSLTPSLLPFAILWQQPLCELLSRLRHASPYVFASIYFALCMAWSVRLDYLFYCASDFVDEEKSIRAHSGAFPLWTVGLGP